MNEYIKKVVPTEIIDLGERRIQFCISNEAQDRDEDIMIATGCDLKNFEENPVFLGFHNYHDFTLGKPEKTWIDPQKGKVHSIVFFPTVEELTGGHPENASEKVKLVDTTYYFYKNKLLNSVSIGFNAKDYERNTASKNGSGRIIKKWELMEFSAVPVPSNPGALAEAVKSFDPTGEMLKTFELAAKQGRRLSSASLASLRAIRGKLEAANASLDEARAEYDTLVGDLDQGDEEEEDPKGTKPDAKNADGIIEIVNTRVYEFDEPKNGQSQGKE